MPIIFHKATGEFHICNEEISYIIKILKNRQLGNLYYGKKIIDRETFSHLIEYKQRPLASVVQEGGLSLSHIKQEYPSYGTSDFRCPAFEIRQKNGSMITDFIYESHIIYEGKRKLEGLPSTYVDDEDEADSLEITLRDSLINTDIKLTYTIYKNRPVITRNARFINNGDNSITLGRALSASVDLPDDVFEMVHLAGAWGRERHIEKRRLMKGVQSIHSLKGASSAEHNPFIALKRPNADEFSGEAYGFSLVYSGNFLAQAEVDTDGVVRLLMGIHPDMFDWPLNPKESFQTPEIVMVYSDNGLNKMSQTYHSLYRERLMQGRWRDKSRPILVNNWEATQFDFNEEKLLKIAAEAKSLGIELFVLDDGWFGRRSSDKTGLGDWYANKSKLPDGIDGLAGKIESLGMRFGLWIEPEMANKDSYLYSKHPDYIVSTPGRASSSGKNQYALDFTRKEVVDYIYAMLEKLFSESKITYVKWDMNRYITECYSPKLESQGMFMHKYILGVYNLYERLVKEFPRILFESCASGGARFDPGILHYAPQTWTSECTDAAERIKIQYGTSLVYPLVSMGNQVSASPNKLTKRETPLETRANTAYFGAFGYEMDITTLNDKEKNKIKRQIRFAKDHRELIQKGVFYRLLSPFENDAAAWIVVSKDKREALAGYYKMMSGINSGTKFFKLQGLLRDGKYNINGNKYRFYHGDELMNIGIVLHDRDFCAQSADFSSALYYLKGV